MVYKRRKYHYGDTHLKKRWRTKRRTKDLDQIDEDIQPEKAEELLNQPVDYDKTGNAQFYCVHCARYFIDSQALHEHFRTKVHKRRMKALELEPYTIEESERAAGFGNFQQANKRKIETIDPEASSSKKSQNREGSTMSLGSKLRNLGIIVRRISSALYITGDKAQTNFAAVTPYLDFDKRIIAKDLLLSSIEARKLPIDLSKIEKRWLFYKNLNEQKIVLEATKVELQNLIKELKQDSENNKSDIEKTVLQLQIVSRDLKNLKDYLYGVEENAALGVLSLPNVLHEYTPIESEVILHEYQTQPQPIDDCHMTLGISQKLIECADGLSCFLKSDAAIFEFALINYFQSVFTDLGFTHISNADFARSNVVEGCGTYYLDNTKIFTVDATSNTDLNKLHLVGGASLYSFMTYFTKHLIQPSLMPLRLFTTGRSYTPISNAVSTLFNLGQSTVGRVFIALEDDQAKMNEILQSLIDNTLLLYKPLNYHIRLLYQPAYKLTNSESLRVSIQMFSNYLKEYVEVGNLSVYDTYLSKRLLFCSTGDQNSFMRVISGEVVNVQKMLGCVLENNASTNAPLLSPILRNFVY